MLKHYFVRGDVLYFSFSEKIDVEEIIIGETKLLQTKRDVNGVPCYAVTISKLNIPLDFRQLKIQLKNSQPVKVELSENLPQIYFIDDDDYDRSGFTWGQRHSDPETNFFICGQVIKYSRVSTHVKFSLAVMQGYRSLELMRDDLIELTEENILYLLGGISELNKSPSVREDRHHLFFSINYVLQLLYIYQNKEDELVTLWQSLDVYLEEIYNEPILKSSIINIINPFIIMSLYLFRAGRSEGKDTIIETSLSFFKKAVVLFDPPFDPVHFKELNMPQVSMSYLLPLKAMNLGVDDINTSIKKHLDVTNLESYIKKTFLKSIRTKGAVNEVLFANFMKFDFNVSNAFVNVIDTLSKTCRTTKNDSAILFQGLTDKIQEADEPADILRRLAFVYEKLENYEMALLIMEKAQALRPNGSVIKKKVTQYLEQLKTE
jgi:hypothetical protein